MSKTQIEYLTAQQADLRKLVEECGDNPSLTKMSFEERLKDVDSELKEAVQSFVGSPYDPAKTEVYFEGAPVVGTKGVRAEFATKAISSFQQFISSVFASDSGMTIAARGLLPATEKSRMLITDVVRGSFGFKLEESPLENGLFGTGLRESLDSALGLMSLAAEESDELDIMLSKTNKRVLDSLASFVELLSKNDATVRLCSPKTEARISRHDAGRIAARLKSLKFEQRETTLEGTVKGILPSNRMFEFWATDNEDGVANKFRGKVSIQLSEAEVDHLTGLTNHHCRATFNIKTVQKRNLTTATTYVLLRIEELQDS